MQHECRITVLETKVFTDYQEKYLTRFTKTFTKYQHSLLTSTGKYAIAQIEQRRRKEWNRYFPSFDDKAMRKAEQKLYGRRAAKMMRTDVQEHDDHYEVDIDLPGFKKDELSLELKAGYLVVSAAKGLDKDEKEKETGRYPCEI